MSDLVQLRQRAAAALPKAQALMLAAQIDEIGYIGALAQAASDQSADNLRHVSRQVSRALDEVDQALRRSPTMTPQQRQELIGQVDIVLANNRQLLEAAHSRAMATIHTAALSRLPAKPAPLDEFMDGLTGDNWEAIKAWWKE